MQIWTYSNMYIPDLVEDISFIPVGTFGFAMISFGILNSQVIILGY